MDFTRLTDYMDYMPKLNVPGCDLAVYKDHELIYRHQSGWRDLERTAPIRGDEAYMLCSATKVFTSCAASAAPAFWETKTEGIRCSSIAIETRAPS